MVKRVISGGQTGSDRGGLRAAIALGVDHGGWCPRGRLAEDGVIPPEFKLVETIDSGYRPRTIRNVQYSDATVILARLPLSSGSLLTQTTAERLGVPYLVLDADDPDEAYLVETLQEWLEDLPAAPEVLNVAGSRESSLPGIESKCERIIGSMLRALRAT